MNIFQVFSLTVVFGLFHGLVLLPVVLSLLGPSSPSEPSDSESVNTHSVSAGSSRSESPARQVKTTENILQAQWTLPA